MSLLVGGVVMRSCHVMAVVDASLSLASGNSAVVNNRFVFTCCGAVCVSVAVDGLFATYS